MLCGQDGNINITSNGGLEPYQYVWSNGLQNQNIGNLTAGNYTVTISDATGCEIIETFDIYQPSKIAANATTTQPTCYGESNGAIGNICHRRKRKFFLSLVQRTNRSGACRYFGWSVPHHNFGCFGMFQCRKLYDFRTG
ncbi:MAG: SprB repeat-containing protein [Saprospiraceae bacterium]|nr:SprB repeat-containing protein [Saprospiraceae bacterium]